MDPRLEQAIEIVAGATKGVPTELVASLYLPVSRWWHSSTVENPSSPLVVSLSGLPGTGKSTLVRACTALLAELFDRSCCGFSLDDVYLTRVERQQLADTVHPLLATRGVPGTHDLALANQTLNQLLAAGPDEDTLLPRFDKLLDDRAPSDSWMRFQGRPDIVVVDGWFWGSVPPSKEGPQTPLNAREAMADPDGSYRDYVRQALAGAYQALFARSSLHLHLDAPSHTASVRWRIEQGRNELAARGLDPKALDPARIRHFLELFERVGTWARSDSPEVRVVLGEDHLPERIVVAAELAAGWDNAQNVIEAT